MWLYSNAKKLRNDNKIQAKRTYTCFIKNARELKCGFCALRKKKKKVKVAPNLFYPQFSIPPHAVEDLTFK